MSTIFPKISIVIPAYNAGNTILETLESVQKQTVSDFEAIVIDDGSIDNTVDLVKGLNDDRIKVFSYANGGIAIARNRGIAHAAGEYIAFLDSDDLWSPNKLEMQLAALEQHPEAGVAYSWTQDFLDGDRTISRQYDPVAITGNALPELLIRNFLNSGSNPLVRRVAVESIDGFDPNCVLCADWDYYIRLAIRWPFVVVPEYQIYYRLSPSSGSAKVAALEKDGLTMINKVYELVPPEFQAMRSSSLADFYQYCAQQYLRHGKTVAEVNQAIPRIRKAIYLRPKLLLTSYTQGLFRWFIKRWVLVQLPFGG
ncbi:glycosyltransferase family 2 protein [Leptolyngbya sp. AN02str]|uniref:glycosyltransferase family 2 protein n=1 Tax=Leptolyngbya sp. AN02str TaxID=3423363 RepID=UPI003D31F73C